MNMKFKSPTSANKRLEFQWHLHNTTQYGGGSLVGINAELAWSNATTGNSIRVAVIDTGFDISHPDLKHNFDSKNWINFDCSDLGRVNSPSAFDSSADLDGKDFIAVANRIIASFVPAQCTAGVFFKVDETSEKVGSLINRFDAHGTATAGIVGANGEVLGVAPNCTIVPIRISTNYTPKAFIRALVYAATFSDVILLPRSLPRDAQLAAMLAVGNKKEEKSNKGKSQNQQKPQKVIGLTELKNMFPYFDKQKAQPISGISDEANIDSLSDQDQWQRVHEIVELVAKIKPLVCAAGNDGRKGLVYPANLDSTIAVGACNEFGYRSTYSNYGQGLTLVAPSSDIASDTESHQRRRRTEEEVKNGASEILGLRGIQTTDNTGPWGYNRRTNGIVRTKGDLNYIFSKGDEEVTGSRVITDAIYRFGGTSASAAIVAGVIALILEKKPELKKKPEEVRKILENSSNFDIAIHQEDGWLPKETDDKKPKKEDLFGAGVVDAMKAVIFEPDDKGA